MIPTYNCADQVGETLHSVLRQARPADEMEIVIVDDASTDAIEQVAAHYGDRVRLHRQPHNLGVPDNLTEALRLSRGHIVHLLHGDDQIAPGFYDAMDQAFADAEIGAAYCRQIFIDSNGARTGISPLVRPEAGRLSNALRFLASEQRIMTPSICVRRTAYERLGGFHPALRCAEDWEMWVRIARDYPIAYIPEPLALYRMQDNSNTGRNVRSARDVAFNALAISLIAAHLPPDIVSETTTEARRTYARSAIGTSRTLAREGDVRAAVAQLRAALALDMSPRTLAAALRAILGIGYSALRGARIA